MKKLSSIYKNKPMCTHYSALTVISLWQSYFHLYFLPTQLSVWDYFGASSRHYKISLSCLLKGTSLYNPDIQSIHISPVINCSSASPLPPFSLSSVFPSHICFVEKLGYLSCRIYLSVDFVVCISLVSFNLFLCSLNLL